MEILRKRAIVCGATRPEHNDIRLMIIMQIGYLFILKLVSILFHVSLMAIVQICFYIYDMSSGDGIIISSTSARSG